MTKPLAEKAMLVRLTRGMFQPDVTDRSATDLVENTTGVRKVGRFRKKLLVNSHNLKAAQEAYQELYTYHQKHTIPWTDAGPRLLPARAYMEYTTEMRTLRAACDNAVMRLAHSWSADVDDDRCRLGAMFVATDYPSDIAARFYHELNFMPVPTAGDFRVEIDPEDLASLEMAIKSAELGATKHIVESLLEPLAKMAEKLAVPIGEEGSVFRNTLLDNLAEVVDRLPALDISDDPAIAAAITRTKVLVEKYGDMHDALRSSPEVRSAAANEAQSQVEDIMKNFAGLL